MKRSICLCWLLGLSSFARADTNTVTGIAVAPAQNSLRDSRAWQDLLTGHVPSATSVRLGKSDFTLSGPILQGFKPRPRFEDRSLGQQILDLPVVSWVIPQRLDAPQGNAVLYFAWNAPSSQPWIAVAGGRPAGSAFSTMGTPGQISISW